MINPPVLYVRPDESVPFSKSFDDLPIDQAKYVTEALVKLEQGQLGNIKFFHGIGELKLHIRPGVRIYLSIEESKKATTIYLYYVGTKSTQQNDIDYAVQLHAERISQKKLGRKNSKANEKVAG